MDLRGRLWLSLNPRPSLHLRPLSLQKYPTTNCHPYLFLSVYLLLHLGRSIPANRLNMFVTFLRATDLLLAWLHAQLHLLDFKFQHLQRLDLRLRGSPERRMPISFWLLMLLVPRLSSQRVLPKRSVDPIGQSGNVQFARS